MEQTDAETLGLGKVAVLLDTQAGQQTSLPSGQIHSTFTHFLLRGLNEAAKNKEGSITVGFLYDYLRTNSQTPQLLPDASSQSARFKLR